jgi:hypothetical protein
MDEGDRYCEARAGATVIRQRLVANGYCAADTAAYWTRFHRVDRWNDYQGMKPAPDEYGAGRCQFTWSWTVFDSTDSESCGSAEVVATDIDSEQQRCAEHVAEVLEQQNPYSRHTYPLRLVAA